MLRIESFSLDPKNTSAPGFAWNEKYELRLENNTWSKTSLRWENRVTGSGGTLSPGNARVFEWDGPTEILVEMVNLASEAVGSFVRRK